MQESVQNHTEEQDSTGTSYGLCLVYGMNQIIPVYLPSTANVEVGDIVFFELEGETVSANIKYFQKCSPDSDIWKAVSISTQMSPIRATKYAGVKHVKWDEKDTAIIEVKKCSSTGLQEEISSDLIINTVAEHFNISPHDLKGSVRGSSFVQPRHIAMYLCRNLTNLSLSSIGEALGGRDHSAIMHGIEKVDSDMKQYEEIRRTIDVLKKEIRPSNS